MVCAAELTVGEYVAFEDDVAEVVNHCEVSPIELGPDGRCKVKLELQVPGAAAKTYVAIASEEFQLEHAPGQEASRRRAGVSAETGVDGDSLSKWEKKVVEKSDAEKTQLAEKVARNVFFEHLDDTERDDLIDVVFQRKFAAGDALMKEGEVGDLFYIIDQGEADIFVMNEKGQDVQVRACASGDSFGELALMYNAPRNATVRAKTDLSCWCMDRETFKYVILGGSIKKRNRYLGFLDSVKILDTMEKNEKMKLVDALIPRKVSAGTEIVRQGDTGDMFYIVERGQVEVAQTTPEGKREVVNEKTAGDYFGEIALMADMPRSATVTAKDDCVLLTLDRKTFVSMMGPLEGILRREVSVYKTFIDYTKV